MDTNLTQKLILSRFIIMAVYPPDSSGAETIVYHVTANDGGRDSPAGGSFENALPFSLSMGCGTWGRNNFSDNLNYQHYLNITRIVRPLPERVPSEEEVFGEYWRKYR